MDVEIGRIQAIYRYPVKSMAGEALEHSQLGWYGLDGDRRFAFRRIAKQDGFPWLTASKLPALLLYKPIRQRFNDYLRTTTLADMAASLRAKQTWQNRRNGGETTGEPVAIDTTRE